MPSALDDPMRVAPELGALIVAMERGAAPIAAICARAAKNGLESGALVGVQTSSRRRLLEPRTRGVRALAVERGAIFQAAYLRAAPRDERDVLGWIVTEDRFRGGAIVLAHELTHYRARFVVWALAEEQAPGVDPSLGRGVSGARRGWVRAQLLNEIAARHVAYLTERAIEPTAGLPVPGALFACALKIAAYPAVYGDDAFFPELLARGDDGLFRDQIGQWLGGLARFPFFEEGSEADRAHRAWLGEELTLARAGRDAPRVDAEGTI